MRLKNQLEVVLRRLLKLADVSEVFTAFKNRITIAFRVEIKDGHPRAHKRRPKFKSDL